MGSRSLLILAFLFCVVLLVIFLTDLGYIAATGEEIHLSIPLAPTPTPNPCPGVPEEIYAGGPINCTTHCDSLRPENRCDCFINCAVANRHLGG